jgi:hypothetical protein
MAMALHQRISTLEHRRLFSVTWNVTVNDPGDLYLPYHATLISFAKAAGRDWERLLAPSSASIEVQINITTSVDLASGGSASTGFIENRGGFDVFEQGVAYELRTGSDPNGAAVDANINLNPTYMISELYFDPGANPASRTGSVPSNRTDAYSTFLHEFGHIFAWNGWRDWTTGTLPGDFQSTFDELVSQVIDDHYFTGINAQDVYGGTVPLTHGNLFHLGNAEPRPGVELLPQLMNGVVFQWATKYDFSPLDIAVLRDVGLPVRTAAPTVTAQSFDYLSGHAVSWTFDAPVRWELSADDVTLTRLDDNSTIGGLSLAYDRGTDTATLSVLANAGILPDGNYRAALSNALVRDLAGNQLDDTYELDFFVLSGDANHDRLVDTSDFNLLAGNFGAGYASFAQGDFNYDGSVNSIDFDIFAASYGNHLPVAPAIAARALFASNPVESDSLQMLLIEEPE